MFTPLTASPARRIRLFELVEPALAALLLVLAVAGHLSQGSPPLAWAMDVATCVVAAFSYRWPLHVALTLLALALCYAFAPTDVATVGELALLIPILGFGLRGERRLGSIFGLLYLAAVSLDTFRNPRQPTFTWLTVLFWACAFVAAWVIGTAFALVRENQRVQERNAVLADRVSTARDLHDTVAHSLAVMSMRAQRAQLRGRVEPSDLDFFVNASAQSVRELRAIMSVLRSEDAGPETEQWRLPTLPDVIDEATERLRRHGFGVSVTSDGDLQALPGTLARVLGKVSREAVNNIIKHGVPGSACSILVEVGSQDVELGFLNPLPAQTGHDSPPDLEPLGLAGMRERVAAVGGVLVAQPSGGQWLTRVTMPFGLGISVESEGTVSA